MSDVSESGPAAPALTTPQLTTPQLTTPPEWLSYLREYSELGVRAGQYARSWMGHQPAAEEAVATAEQRLGVQFPPSYRSFLLTTDGWDDAGCWVDLVYSCADICWLRDTDEGHEFIDIYGALDVRNDEYVAVFQRALKVTNGEDFWFLDPTENGPDGECAAYLFRSQYGQLERFASFAGLWHENRRLMTMFAAE